MRRPLLEWLSFLCILKCSVSVVIRFVKIAICTSGDPVSSFELANSEDQETSAIGLSYTSGGITVSGSMHDGENLGGSAATTADKAAYEVNITFAF